MKKKTFGLYVLLIYTLLLVSGCSSQNSASINKKLDNIDSTVMEQDTTSLAVSTLENVIVTPISTSDCEGRYYHGVEKAFEDAGFTNVVLYSSEVEPEETDQKDGEVVNVWSKGKESFEKGEYLEKDSEIAICYIKLIEHEKVTDSVSDIKYIASTSEDSTSETKKDEYSYKEISATKYAKTAINVRAVPDLSGDKIGSLDQSTEVLVTGQCNETGWYRIIFNGSTAYVNNDYLIDTKPADESAIESLIPAAGVATAVEIINVGEKENVELLEDSNGEILVWIPVHGGSKYHLKSTCSNMKSPVQVTIEQAENSGFTPCKKCFK